MTFVAELERNLGHRLGDLDVVTHLLEVSDKAPGELGPVACLEVFGSKVPVVGTVPYGLRQLQSVNAACSIALA